MTFRFHVYFLDLDDDFVPIYFSKGWSCIDTQSHAYELTRSSVTRESKPQFPDLWKIVIS